MLNHGVKTYLINKKNTLITSLVSLKTPTVPLSNLILHLFLILSTFCLTSCMHHTTNDGPPSFYVDENKIPNANPKLEPLAKYGNMSSYVVFGKRYYTLKSSKNFEETGVASWYGTKFHARHTSSGERYNMLAMTAAHKSLPLPTYVEVTNLKNKRKVIVKVNDRGPFKSNRIIDLSYVAAKKLHMLGHGTALVRIRAIDPFFFAQKTGHLIASKIKHSYPRESVSHIIKPKVQQAFIQNTKSITNVTPKNSVALSKKHFPHKKTIAYSQLIDSQLNALSHQSIARLNKHLASKSVPLKKLQPLVKSKLSRLNQTRLKRKVIANKLKMRLKKGIASSK